MRALVDALLLGRDSGPSPKWVRAATAVAVVVLAAASAGSGEQASGYLGWVLGLATAVPFAIAAWSSLWAWRWAWLAAIAVGLLVLPRVAGWPWHPVQLIVLLLVLFVVGLRQRLGVVLWVGLFTAVPVWLYVLPNNRVGATLLYAVPLAMGWLLGGRLAAQRRLAAEQERGAVLTERARIARELHDVVAHHMSLIAVRAETAGYRVTDVDGPARQEFSEIAGAAREALTEMRRLLGVLRDGEAAPTAPQ
ncbi:MAG: sensor histidine kinase, partial [Micromonosporaceae bacterium]